MKKQNCNYEDSILKFLKSYRIKHGSSKTMEIMDDIIQKKPIDNLSKDLEKMGAERLSEELSKIVLKQIRSDIPDKYNVTSLLPSILQNHITISNKENHSHNGSVRFVKRTFAKAAILACATMVLCISKPSIANMGDVHQEKLVSGKMMISPKTLQIIFSNLFNDDTYKLEKVNYKIANQKIVTPPAISTQEPTKVPNLEAASKKDTNDYKKSKKLEEKGSELDTMLESEEKKNEILNDFHKCKTIDSILKRQEQLESLGLTKQDKLYKDCKLSAPLQRFIYEQSLAWNVTPADFTFAIIDTETRGDFDSSGFSTYNESSDTSDLGLTQQNDYYRVKPFAKLYNISYKEAKELVQNNDYVNVVCALLEYQEIASCFDGFDAEEYAGCYNGWLEWRKIESSRYYVQLFQNTYQNKYTKYHKIESMSITKKGKNKVNIKK